MAQVTPFPSPRRQQRSRWITAAAWSGGFVALLWLVELLDVLSGNQLDDDGIRPLDPDGLVGVLLAPFLHGSWAHLLSNTGPLLVLGFLVLLSGVGRWLQVMITVMVVSGLGTWVVGGAGTVHIGASGVVFGLLAYLLVRGWFARDLKQIAVGVLVFLVYGSLLWGVLPTQVGVSWQAHLFGAVGGVVAAWMLDRREAPALRG
ncbi:rhomboid family intramembrane serine protease [Nocardioides yefusunii]|uniref:Rhomboid family intramembrane serine protease n=1 Tax=Nocardioides yefusunii TaxID=2500546 RepID=A0ABW1QTN8_9ACTN|nr:rhomboid family intramembrane serine protease [Nocardioides yefusunii]